MAHDLFISYSAKDKVIADPVCATLEGMKIRCWIAPRDVPPGQTWASALVEAIGASRVFVLVFSDGSNNSPQVFREVGEAVEKGIPIIPFRIEDVQPSKEMGYYIKALHWLDALTPPLEKHLQKLGDTVQALLVTAREERPPAETPEAKVPEAIARTKTIPRAALLGAGLLVLLVMLSTVAIVWQVMQSKGTPSQDSHATETRIAAIAFATQTASISTATDIPTQTSTPALKETPTFSPTQATVAVATATSTSIPTPNGTATQVAFIQLATATMQACLHQSPIAPLSWPVVLCDTFFTNPNGWATGSNDNSFVTVNGYIANGKYHWDWKSKVNIVSHEIPRFAKSVSDFYLTLEGQRVGGEGEVPYGVVFRYDGTNYYFLKIEAENQAFSVELLYQGQWKILTDWTRTSAIRPNLPNRLTIRAEGSHFILYINDEQVHAWDDSTLSKGTAGIAIHIFNPGDTAVFDFTHFELRAP